MATTKITSPDLFDLGSLNTALQLPSGTTAERPTSPSTGEWRYNTTTNLVEFWDGGEWRDLQSENIPPINSENFNTVLYTGTSATHSITGVGFKPDLVWIKDRNNGESHIWNDSTRGAGNDLSSNTTAAQTNRPTGFVSFDSDGFTLGTDGGGVVNDSSRGPYVAWCWKAKGGTTSSNTDGTITSTVQANTKAGFSIVTYTGDGANGTVGHGLGVAPDIVLVKRLNSTGSWSFNGSVGGLTYGTNKLVLQTTAAISADTNEVTAATSTTFTAGTSGSVGASGGDYVAYCFYSVAGYSSFGSYTGNGSLNGPIVNTGFEPAFVMIKRTDLADNWSITDNKRSTSNPRANALFPNGTGVELTSGYTVDYLSNGFQIKSTDNAMNANGGAYIYIAFAADQSAAPALPDSFVTALYSGTGSSQSITGLGFSPSFTWIKNRVAANSHNLYDTIRGATKLIESDTSDAEVTSSTGLTAFLADGFTVSTGSGVNNATGQYVSWNWKANSIPTINTDGTIQSVVSANSNSGFSIVKWTTNGSASQTVGHGLSSTPELIIFKRLDSAQEWFVETNAIDGGYDYANLNTTAAFQDGGAAWSTRATSTTITAFTSSNNFEYVAYCFYSVSGFSKFGSYTGNGGTLSVNVGFAAAFVMVKKSSGTSSWFLFDSARGDYNRLFPDSSQAESFSGNQIALTSTGFTSGNGGTNNSGSTYIYMAFKENPSTTVVPAGEMSFLLVAGGGGGGIAYGGGGGAGGLRTSFGSTSGGGASAETNITLANGIYNVTIGAGGAGISAAATGNSGSNSSISGNASFSTTGGGGGGSSITNTSAHPAGSGGSGGGGSVLGQQSPYTQAGAAGTANEGFGGGQGGFGSFNGTTGAGGGGGAGGAGDNGKTSGYRLGGNGGDGLAVNIIPGGVFAGGGGAGSEGSTNSTPGIGGGGKGGYTSASSPTSGIVNTGGGGGGSGNTTSVTSGAGGSGVGILRMRTTDYSGNTTGSPIVRVYGEETILVFTGSGSYTHS